MVKLNKIYTKTGDRGTTRLTSGAEVAKFDIRIEAYGTVDELNSFVGMASLMADHNPKLRALLQYIQHDLFDLGADLSTPKTPDEKPDQALRIIETQTHKLENLIDEFNENLEPLRSFVLPSGTKLAAQLHICRTITRRAERFVANLLAQNGDRVNIECLKYLNRLSDLFFVLSRYENVNAGKGDILWLPAKNR
ncbi:MAG: cob(I)yrinic acid a,c-diamide adenosyltransferase [Rhizobiales bacterium]|nr:cob(I)yrinic acid a,c-diamide adenosyltransferase [Hyphomicrobiales bacterium]